MKKTRKTLLVSAVVLLGWIPTATIAATSAYTANAAVVGSNNQPSNNNSQKNNNQPSNNSNINNNNNKVTNNTPANNNNNNYNNNTSNNSSSYQSGLTNIQELSGYHSVTLAGPSGFVYSLYSSSGSKGSRGLAGDTSWYTDKTAQDSSGNTYYRVSTDEWVEASTGVTFN
ncbi:hypothetical protein [Companilactobacillus sp.]|jgi:lipopolysaccharide export LptBFGC system permease protein LptF|uniref:hypothetical protein n=1 Tax=Companilactobacillus sp. TaxID=2767905 RepID=UPI0025BD22E3|nr:hypothetical protein [Companilactobacillus sp.]MCH4009387.1 hypothetical protein [Companilactobacillus sp.]MCH4050434.1 hypothetical protein [Companilactobacillus sp.]MCH4077329.1 hypothetical protein [Companilactobacillus sp.]MCH4125905.1 hypothetical protein [Companilactobacillus sp.]MCI1311614.1 hypothetical protein [Companilactobacillus sp.]